MAAAKRAKTTNASRESKKAADARNADANAQKLLGVVEALKEAGTYPAPLTRVVELSAIAGAPAAKALKTSPLKERLLCLVPPGAPATKPFAILREDLDPMLDTWILAALAAVRSPRGPNAFAASQIAKALPKPAAAPKSSITDAFSAREREARWPEGVGSLRYRSGRTTTTLLFALDDVIARSVVAPPRRAADRNATREDAPSFETAFERAFDRLDRQLGDRNFVLLRALREALPSVSRSDFDRGITALRIARRFTLEASDGRHARLLDEEVDAGIRDGGSVLVYASRRGS